MHRQEVALAQREKAQTRKNRNAQAKKKAPKRPTQKEDLKAIYYTGIMDLAPDLGSGQEPIRSLPVREVICGISSVG